MMFAVYRTGCCISGATAKPVYIQLTLTDMVQVRDRRHSVCRKIMPELFILKCLNYICSPHKHNNIQYFFNLKYCETFLVAVYYWERKIQVKEVQTEISNQLPR